jgi:hypothetical protein
MVSRNIVMCRNDLLKSEEGKYSTDTMRFKKSILLAHNFNILKNSSIGSIDRMIEKQEYF